MVLTYAKYIDCMTALDEFTKGTLTKRDLQNAIFKHYIKEDNIIAENLRGSKRLFVSSTRKSRLKSERQSFIKFMEET